MLRRLFHRPTPRSSSAERQRARTDGLRLTRVGSWVLIFLVVIAVAATNTSNNGLYLVAAVLAGGLVLAHLVGGRNVRGLDVQLHPHDEIYANQLTHLDLAVTHRGWLPRWWLLVTVDPRDVEPVGGLGRRSRPMLASYLRRGERATGEVGVFFARRGRRRLTRAHVWSLFPFGFFRKGRRYPTEAEVLVYPEIFSGAAAHVEQTGKTGDEPTYRAGWGHELLGLREYRVGDDPRHIHWKQSARLGNLVFQEQESEESRRLLIVLDNAVGALDRDAERRFERLISEAATAAVDYLERGFEVALSTREGHLPFSNGTRQRHAILEALALLEARPAGGPPLESVASQGIHLRLGLDPRPSEPQPSEPQPSEPQKEAA